MKNRLNIEEFVDKTVDGIKKDIASIGCTPYYICYLVADKDGTFNKASEKYVNLKHHTAEACGVMCIVKKLTLDEFIQSMNHAKYNIDKGVRAMLQLPAPKEAIDAFNEKCREGFFIDVDYLGDEVLTNMWIKNDFTKAPATPRGVVEFLEYKFGSLEGKKIAVVGSRSKTTGKFLVPMLQNKNATVSMYHSKSHIGPHEFSDYNIVISCVGSPRFINSRNLGFTAKTCIDIGVSVVNGKVIGDFSEDIRECHLYTPYTNGVGLLTRVYLVDNVVKSYMC